MPGARQSITVKVTFGNSNKKTGQSVGPALMDQVGKTNTLYLSMRNLGLWIAVFNAKLLQFRNIESREPKLQTHIVKGTCVQQKNFGLLRFRQRRVLLYYLHCHYSQENYCFSNKILHFLKPLKTKLRPLYLKTQSVPRCKYFSSRLQKPISLCCKWHKSQFVLR